MLPLTGTYPDYREIETPWEPQPIAWRFQHDETRPAFAIHQSGIERINSVPTLQAQANNPALTHLVREVAVSTRHGIGLEMSPKDTLNDLKLVDDQFRQLEALSGFRVASTEWHVFQDNRGLTRTLARVAIIDGYERALPEAADFEELAEMTYLSPDEYELAYTYLTGIDKYFRGAKGTLLADVDHPRQYVFGAPRSHDSDGAIYLVDIEPDLQKEYGTRDLDEDQHC